MERNFSFLLSPLSYLRSSPSQLVSPLAPLPLFSSPLFPSFPHPSPLSLISARPSSPLLPSPIHLFAYPPPLLFPLSLLCFLLSPPLFPSSLFLLLFLPPNHPPSHPSSLLSSLISLAGRLPSSPLVFSLLCGASASLLSFFVSPSLPSPPLLPSPPSLPPLPPSLPPSLLNVPRRRACRLLLSVLLLCGAPVFPSVPLLPSFFLPLLYSSRCASAVPGSRFAPCFLCPRAVAAAAQLCGLLYADFRCAASCGVLCFVVCDVCDVCDVCYVFDIMCLM